MQHTYSSHIKSIVCNNPFYIEPKKNKINADLDWTDLKHARRRLQTMESKLCRIYIHKNWPYLNHTFKTRFVDYGEKCFVDYAHDNIGKISSIPSKGILQTMEKKFCILYPHRHWEGITDLTPR